MGWSERKPEPTDIPNAELASLLTSNKQTFRTYLEKHFYWSQSSGASAGIPILSLNSFGPGSARAAYIPSSAISASVSVPLKSGSLIVESDTSRAVTIAGSTTSSLFGSANAVVVNGPIGPTITAGARWLEQSGSITFSGASSTQQVGTDFPTPYSATPFVQITTMSAGTNQLASSAVTAISASRFTVMYIFRGGGTDSGTTIFWNSLGTVPL